MSMQLIALGPVQFTRKIYLSTISLGPANRWFARQQRRDYLRRHR